MTTWTAAADDQAHLAAPDQKWMFLIWCLPNKGMLFIVPDCLDESLLPQTPLIWCAMVCGKGSSSDAWPMWIYLILGPPRLAAMYLSSSLLCTRV